MEVVRLVLSYGRNDKAAKCKDVGTEQSLLLTLWSYVCNVAKLDEILVVVSI